MPKKKSKAQANALPADMIQGKGAASNKGKGKGKGKAKGKSVESAPKIAKNDSKVSAKGSGRGGTKKGAATGSEGASKAASKAQRKQANAARTAALRAQQAAMMPPSSSSDSDSEYISGSDDAPELDRFGNVVAKGGALEPSAAALAAVPPITTPPSDSAEATIAHGMDATVDDTTASDGGVGGANSSDLPPKPPRALTRREKKEAERRKRLADAMANDVQSLAASGSTGSQSASQFDVQQPAGEAPALSAEIHIDGLTVSVGTGRQRKTLLNDAVFRLGAGSRVALVGPNGQGKSALLKLLAAGRLRTPANIDVLLVEQEAAPSESSVLESVLEADTERTSLMAQEADILERIRAGGMHHPEAEATGDDELLRVYEALAACDAEQAEPRARRILAGLGFGQADMSRPTKELSGGWRMRIALARALFIRPTLLLLDEPTNHLDVNAVLWLSSFLSHWPKALLVVSHDAAFIDTVIGANASTTDDAAAVEAQTRGLIMEIHEKKLYYVRGGSVEALWRAQARRHELAERDYAQQQREYKALLNAGHHSAAEAVKEVLQRDHWRKRGNDSSELIAKPKQYEVTFNFCDGTGGGAAAAPTLRLTSVHFAFSGQPVLFHGIDFEAQASNSCRIAVVGSNGVGKSTLLSLLVGELEPSRGEVQRSMGLVIGRYAQHFVDQLPLEQDAITFLINSAAGGGDAKRKQRCHLTLGRFGLESHAHQVPLRELSGGQKVRVVFAALALARPAPNLLVLDEPTNHLDLESVQALGDALRRFSGGVVLVTHDARLIERFAPDPADPENPDACGECELWECARDGDHTHGVTLKRVQGGFGVYVRKVLLLAEEGALHLQ